MEKHDPACISNLNIDLLIRENQLRIDANWEPAGSCELWPSFKNVAYDVVVFIELPVALLFIDQEGNLTTRHCGRRTRELAYVQEIDSPHHLIQESAVKIQVTPVFTKIGTTEYVTGTAVTESIRLDRRKGDRV